MELAGSMTSGGPRLPGLKSLAMKVFGGIASMLSSSVKALVVCGAR